MGYIFLGGATSSSSSKSKNVVLLPYNVVSTSHFNILKSAVGYNMDVYSTDDSDIKRTIQYVNVDKFGYPAATKFADKNIDYYKNKGVDFNTITKIIPGGNYNIYTSPLDAYYGTDVPISNNYISLNYAFTNSDYLFGNPYVGNKAENIEYAYYNCVNLTGYEGLLLGGENVINMDHAFWHCGNLKGTAYIGPNVTNAGLAFSSDFNITSIQGEITNKCTNLYSAFYGSSCPGRIVIHDMTAPVTYNYKDMFLSPYRTLESQRVLVNIDDNSQFIPLFLSNINMTFTRAAIGNYWYNSTNKIYIFSVYNTNTHIRNCEIINLNLADSRFKNLNFYYNQEFPQEVKAFLGEDALTWIYLNNIYTVFPQQKFKILNQIKITNTGAVYYINKIDDYFIVPSNLANSFYKTKLSGEMPNWYWVNEISNAFYGTNISTTLNAPNIINMSYAFGNTPITTPTCGENVINMQGAYELCLNITTAPAVCGEKVVDMSRAYNMCVSYTGSPVCGDNVVNMSYAYNGCRAISGSPVCGNNVVDMSRAYSGCLWINGIPEVGPKVTNMSGAYYNVKGITQAVCPDNIIDISYAYQNCNKLSGEAVLGPNVENMEYVYYNCINITGSPICGEKVVNMAYSYYNCTNINGEGICGQNVTNMDYTYFMCSGITHGYIRRNVKSAHNTYGYCTKLTEATINTMANLEHTFQNCSSLKTIYCAGPGFFYGTFENCGNLTDVHVSSGGYLNNNSFYNAYSLRNVAFIYGTSHGTSVNYRSTFYNCRKLENIYGLGAGNYYYAFQSLANLKEVTLSLEGYSHNAFKNCQNLTYVDFSLTRYITSYNSGITSAFTDCPNIKEAVYPYYTTYRMAFVPTLERVSGGPIYNANYAFQGATKLRDFDPSFILGTTGTQFSYTFNGCTNLTRGDFSSSMINIPHMYDGCINLISGGVGKNVINAYMAYFGCPNLQGNFYYYPTTYINNSILNFAEHNTQRRLNILLVKGSSVASQSSVFFNGLPNTYDSVNKIRYSTDLNIYIYESALVGDPVEVLGVNLDLTDYHWNRYGDYYKYLNNLIVVTDSNRNNIGLVANLNLRYALGDDDYNYTISTNNSLFYIENNNIMISSEVTLEQRLAGTNLLITVIPESAPEQSRNFNLYYAALPNKSISMNVENGEWRVRGTSQIYDNYAGKYITTTVYESDKNTYHITNGGSGNSKMTFTVSGYSEFEIEMRSEDYTGSPYENSSRVWMVSMPNKPLPSYTNFNTFRDNILYSVSYSNFNGDSQAKFQQAGKSNICYYSSRDLITLNTTLSGYYNNTRKPRNTSAVIVGLNRHNTYTFEVGLYKYEYQTVGLQYSGYTEENYPDRVTLQFKGGK